ncbi:hypothetical protein ACLKA6_001813 [Drosophila palustris]
MELLRRSLESERELFNYPAKIKLFRRTLEIQDNQNRMELSKCPLEINDIEMHVNTSKKELFPIEIDGNPKGMLENCSEPPTICIPMEVAIIEEKEFNRLGGNSQIQELDHFFKNMNI